MFQNLPPRSSTFHAHAKRHALRLCHTPLFRAHHVFALVLVSVCSALAHADAAEARYVGSENCVSCHQDQTDLWKMSDHFKAMAEATSSTVLGDFNNAQVIFHGVHFRFYTQDDAYFVETRSPNGRSQSFKMDYVFGHYPLQQYLIDMGDGHFQAFNVAWDSRTKAQGGQRWYHLQPNEDITAEHPFHWTGSFQNWNARCAECHSTNLQKNYDAAAHSYNTTWTDINVACEACHGPGSRHLELAKAGKLNTERVLDSGLAYAMEQALGWQFEKDEVIAKPILPKGQANLPKEHVDMCGSCHSRRQLIDDPTIPGDYHEKHRIQTLDQAIYFADGQIQDEVYVLGSFLQSKMHQAGVTCMNCHEPHSAKLIAEPNQVCSQCHLSSHYETEKHTFHTVDTQPLCVDCHMPERTYMGVDPRRDHSFTIPRPQLTASLQVPIACQSCHENKPAGWAEQVFKEKGIKPHTPSWIKTKYTADQQDSRALRPLYRALSDDDLPPIIRATLLKNIANFPSREALTAIQTQLKSDNALVRSTAVSSLGFVDDQTRWALLAPMLEDKSKLVRFELAPMLASFVPRLSGEQKTTLLNIIDEYRAALNLSADMPGSQLAIADLELRFGNLRAAEKAYKKAIELVPAFVPALLNFSDFLRNQGRTDDEKVYLEQALDQMPDSAAVNHALGLFYIRAKHYDQALPYLKTAAVSTGLDASPRFAYVYAVALDTLGQTELAVTTLRDADRRWPRQYESLIALVMYLEKTNNTELISPYLRVLNTLAPQSPQVQAWIKKYGLF